MMAQSPISDAFEQTAPPEPKKAKKAPTEWEKLGKSKAWKDINAYLEGRKERYRRFLPTGESVVGLKKEERAENWERAVLIISEIEAIQGIVARHSGGK